MQDKTGTDSPPLGSYTLFDSEYDTLLNNTWNKLEEGQKRIPSNLPSLLSSVQFVAMRRQSRGLDKKPGKTDNQGQENNLTATKDRTTLPQQLMTRQHYHNYQ